MAATPKTVEGRLLAALATELKALRVGAKPAFTAVMVGGESDSEDAFRSSPAGILTVGASQWDGENPELGSLSIYLDIFVFDSASLRGKLVLYLERQLTDLVELVRTDANNFVGGDFLAGVWLESAEPPALAERGGSYVWTSRVTFGGLRG